MPRYDLKCAKCDKTVEVMCRYDDIPNHSTCAECGEQMEKVFPTSTTFRLEGGGWYNSDYKGRKGPIR